MINIEWNYKENPNRSGYYTVTVEYSIDSFVLFHVWYDCDLGWCLDKGYNLVVSAWAEDIIEDNIEPYKKEEFKFKVGDIVVNSGAFVGVVTNITGTTMYIMWADGSCGWRDKDNVPNEFDKIGSCTDEFKNVLNILEDTENKL